MRLTNSYPSLTEKHVLISGGASGIGGHMVDAFSENGARVTFLDIDTQSAEKRLAKLAGRPVFYQHCDVSDLASLQLTLAEIGSEQPVNVLINNAARDDRQSVDAVTPDTWRELLAVNLDHQFFATQSVLPGMRAAGRGSIINMASITSVIGFGGVPAYVAAKGAIEALTRSLARDLGVFGVRVNAIIPGFVKTEKQVEKWLTPELEQEILEAQALKSLIDPDYIAAMALFLASDDAALCTGRNYFVDAGWL